MRNSVTSVSVWSLGRNTGCIHIWSFQSYLSNPTGTSHPPWEQSIPVQKPKLWAAGILFQGWRSSSGSSVTFSQQNWLLNGTKPWVCSMKVGPLSSRSPFGCSQFSIFMDTNIRRGLPSSGSPIPLQNPRDILIAFYSSWMDSHLNLAAW